MEDDRLEEGRYGRAFGCSEPGEEDEEPGWDVEVYLRNLKRKKADKEGTSPKQDEPHRSEKENASIGVSDGSESADDDRTIPNRTDKKTTPLGIGDFSDCFRDQNLYAG